MSDHYYDVYGNPCHTQLCGPRAKNLTRSTTITDARKQQLYGSVTTCLKIKHSPTLVDWMVREGIYAALTAERRPGEDMNQFINRIVVESRQKSKDATDFGSECHKHVENVNRNPDYQVPYDNPFGEQMVNAVEYWRQYKEENILSVLHAERSITCQPLGVAGTVDLTAEYRDYGLVVGDFKTQTVKPPKEGKEKKAAFWPNFGWQMAVYAKMVQIVDGLSEPPRIISHVIDSVEPSPVYTKVYTPEEQHASLVMGLTLVKAWFLDNDYIPETTDKKLFNVW